MKFLMMICLLSVVVYCSCKPQGQLQMAPEPIRAYVKKIGLDSISRAGFLQERYIRFNSHGITITKAVAYFYHGMSFSHFQTQPFVGNRFPIPDFYSAINAGTAFKVRITGIHYIDGNGKKGQAEEFSFIVY